MRDTVTVVVALLGVLLTPCPVPAGPIGSEREVTPRGEVIGMFAQPSGGYVVVWERDASGVAGREYDAAGEPLGAAFPFVSSAFDVDDVVRDTAGRFVVVESKSDGYSDGVFGKRYDANGASLGAEFQANTTTGGGQQNAALAPDGAGGFLVVWEDAPFPNDIIGRRFDGAAAPAGAEFLVNAAPSDNVSDPAATGDGVGNFIAVWSGASVGDGQGVFVRRFDGTGAALGAAFLVNTYTSGSQYDPTVSSDGAGNFVVVWRGPGAGDGQGVFARRFDGSGNPVGTEFLVNTWTTGLQGDGRASYGGSGEFIITWHGSSEGAGQNVLARRFDAGGVALGPEFQVNTNTGSGAPPQALIHPGGEFTVTWPGPGHDIWTSTRSQRFDAAGTPVPGEVPISGKRLAIIDPPLPSRRSISVASADAAAVNGLNPLVRPDVNGAFLHVYNPTTGDSACMPLPAGGWVHVGTLDDPFVYIDADYANGPCRLARLTRYKRISARCRGAGIGYTLDEPTQGGVVVSLTLGSARYCAVFDGASIRKDSGPDGRFVARNSGAPAACPAPPVSCP